MVTLVIGGSGRGVGKTSLACGLLRALCDLNWTAIKITRHDHGAPGPVWEATAAHGGDTARYLEAGARRALLVTAPDSDLPLTELDAACNGVEFALIESNRILEFLLPDVCLAVVGDADAKPSFATLLERADAIVVCDREAMERIHRPPSSCVFLLQDCGCPPPELVAWVRGRLIAGS